MKTISELLLLFFLLNCIANLQAELKKDEKEPQEIKIGSKVEYDKNNNYFSFQYEGSNAALIVKFIDKSESEIYLKNSRSKKIELKDLWGRAYIGNLTNSGTYYLEINCSSIYCEIGGKFETSLYGDILETIDLSKNIYYQDFELENTEIFYGNIKYNVSGLKEDKYVLFKAVSNYYTDYYPYYPNESVVTDDLDYPDFSNLTIFEVTNISSGNSERNLNVYHFVKNTKYIIDIHCLKKSNSFKYIQFLFIPITNSSIRRFQGDEGMIIYEGPIHGIVNASNEKEFYMFFNYINNYNKIYYVNTSETIESFEQYLDILPKLQPISVSDLHFKEEKTDNSVILLLPENYEYKSRLYLVEELDDECENVVRANKNKILYCKGDEEMQIDKSKIFYSVITLTSNHRNMRYLFSENDNNTDYIIHNHFFQPIYIEKNENDCSIQVKKYSKNFAFFGAENPFLFNSIYNYYKRILNDEDGINIDNYIKLPQVNFRINSIFIPFFDFFNAYLIQSDIKINIYIKQLYGGSELYECDDDGYDIKNLDFLANPVSNVKCKNKKSLFNRLFNLEGTKILAGYITPDSYFDIYAEIDDNTSAVINPFPLEESEKILFGGIKNNAKYLKKGVEYIINFELDHLIKLDPEFDAEIIISNKFQEKIINPQNPTLPVSGKEYTIQSNNDAMIYFIQKLPSNWYQTEIDIKNSKGKIITKYPDKEVIIDFGFKNYIPSNIPLYSLYHYIDNSYDRLKAKLVEGEKLYIYSKENIDVSYRGNNLNNKNNDFNIFLVPNDNEESYLIVKTVEKLNIKIKFDLFFCKEDTTLELSFIEENNQNKSIITDKTYKTYSESMREYKKINEHSFDIEMIFKSNQSVVFTYSYYDLFDENIYKENNNFKKEREILSKSKIEEIVPKNEREIKIKFTPHYKQSTTRYIILIAQKSSENTFENFKDACFVTGLLTQRPNGVKVEAIYDGGIDDSINAEVDISDILSEKNNKYLMSIISQELRYSRKINFYDPQEFTFGSIKPDEDDELKGVYLALAIVLPIIGAIIIAIVIIFLVRSKCHKQEDTVNDEALSKLANTSYEL